MSLQIVDQRKPVESETDRKYLQAEKTQGEVDYQIRINVEFNKTGKALNLFLYVDGVNKNDVLAKTHLCLVEEHLNDLRTASETQNQIRKFMQDFKNLLKWGDAQAGIEAAA